MASVKRVRILFVISSILFISLMLGLIIFFSYKKSYKHMTDNADKKLEQILENDEQLEGNEHYFIVSINSNHKLNNLKLVNVSKSVSDSISRYVKTIMSKDEEKGYIDGYRYMLKKDKRNREVTIAFLSRSGNENMLRQNVRSMVQFSILGVIIIGIILIFVSKLVVWPIEEGERRQKEFISAASHALKTPLTIISTTADLLGDDYEDNEWVDIIKEQADYMTGMTNNLVMLTKLQSNNSNIKHIEFPISDVLGDILHSFAPVAQSKEQKVDENIEKNVSYVGNENDIRQLFTLLLDNAHKYAGVKGRVYVELKSKKNEIVLVIKNTSVKYDKKQLERLFDRFYRGNESKEKGFGIGLYVAKTIVNNHKGIIDARMEDDFIVFEVRLR